jgi:hypothetical protein
LLLFPDGDVVLSLGKKHPKGKGRVRAQIEEIASGFYTVHFLVNVAVWRFDARNCDVVSTGS